MPALLVCQLGTVAASVSKRVCVNLEQQQSPDK